MVDKSQLLIQLALQLSGSAARHNTSLTSLSHLILTRGPRKLGLNIVGARSCNIMIIKMMGLPIPVVFLAEAYPAVALVLVPELGLGLELAPGAVAAAEQSNISSCICLCKMTYAVHVPGPLRSDRFWGRLSSTRLDLRNNLSHRSLI